MLEQMTTEYGPLFAIPAIAGSFFFLLRFIMMIAGAGIDGDAGGHDMGGHDLGGHDVGVGAGADAGEGGSHHHDDSTDSFKVLSIQSIAGFIMGFGWGGLGAYRGLNWDVEMSLLAAVAGGALIVWILAMIFKSIGLLYASGNISIQDAVGCTGSVYVGVPARNEGKGKVRLVVNNRARIFNAVSSGEELPRNTRVKVVMVNRDNTVTIARDDS